MPLDFFCLTWPSNCLWTCRVSTGLSPIGTTRRMAFVASIRFLTLRSLDEDAVEAKSSWKTSEKTSEKDLMIYPGWWFGTFFIFPYIGNVIIPIDFHIFQRGGPTTNQYHSSDLLDFVNGHWWLCFFFGAATVLANWWPLGSVNLHGSSPK